MNIYYKIKKIMTYLKTGLLLTLSFITLQCSAQKKVDKKNHTALSSAVTKMNIQKIVLEEMTRGSRRMVTITPTSKIVEVNRQVKQVATQTAEWTAILENLSAEKLSRLETFEAPTTKRYYDGAFSADIKITAGDKVYTSQSFDSGTPPNEISEFYFSVAKNFKDR